MAIETLYSNCCFELIEQLKRVEDNLHGINAHAKRAEADLTKMEKCCGCFHLPCAKSVMVAE